MTPISITVEAFGPYVQRQEVLFAPFLQAGLLLIRGETGAGKTALLDAMTYALYGRSSGGQRGELKEMRCLCAPEDAQTSVEYVFELAGKRYRFARCLRVRRKRTGTLEYQQEQNCWYLDEQGVFVPFFANPKQKDLEQKAQQLIGLDCGQFCQVMLLPQGQFERLLTAKSEDKEAVLVSLFQAERWQRVAERLCAQASGWHKRLEAQRAGVQALLSRHGCTQMEELEQRLSELLVQLEEKQTVRAQGKQRLEQARQLYEAQTQLDTQFERLSGYQAQLLRLDAQTQEMEEIRQRIQRAKQAQAALPLIAQMQTAQKEFARRTQALSQGQRLAELARQRLEQAQAHQTAAEKERPAYEAAQARLRRLEPLREGYQHLAQIKQKQIKAKAGQQQARQQAEKAVKARSAQEQECQALEQQQQTAWQQYLCDSAVALASDLQEGARCPVCGSVHHPQPAVSQSAQAQSNVSAERLDELGAHLRQQRQILEQRREQERQLTQKAAQADAVWERIQAEYLLLEGQRDAEIADLAALDQTLSNLQTQIEQQAQRFILIHKQAEELSIQEREAAAALPLLLQEQQRAQKQVQDAEQALAPQLEQTGDTAETLQAAALPNQQIDQLTEQLLNWNNQRLRVQQEVTQLADRLEGMQRPALEELRQLVQTQQQALSELDQAYGAQQQSCQRMQEDLQTIRQTAGELAQECARADKLAAFGKLLRGDNGVSLRRYLLGVMLASVTGEANRLLAHVHGGRYRLYHTLEGVGRTRKVGLDLEVLDAHSGQRRSVAGLSGGEKFLVSLALALGLAAVVQSQSGGVQLDAMFIDEGFGSLDPQSIDDALEVLAQVRGSRRLVGIISHVTSLRESIEASIEVVKERGGSRLEIHS